MKPQISDFVLGSLNEMDKHIEVLDGHLVKTKQKGEVKIKMRCDNGKHFITTLYGVIFAPDLWYCLFSWLC